MIWRARQPSPLVIAHRGASKDAPENTRAAFRLAREQGADGVELDVMRCASGEIVVFHDDDLQRLCGRGGWLRRLGWDELRGLSVLGSDERMPLLSEVFDVVGDLLVNIELKSAPDWGGRARDDGLARAVAEFVRDRKLAEQVLISSFDPLLLGRFRMSAPEVPTGLLFAHDQGLPLRRAWARPLVRPTAMHPDADLVDAVAMDDWRGRDLAVHVWTVDEPAELRCLAALGVDGVITNRPKVARKVISSQNP